MMQKWPKLWVLLRVTGSSVEHGLIFTQTRLQAVAFAAVLPNVGQYFFLQRFWIVQQTVLADCSVNGILATRGMHVSGVPMSHNLWKWKCSTWAGTNHMAVLWYDSKHQTLKRTGSRSAHNRVCEGQQEFLLATLGHSATLTAHVQGRNLKWFRCVLLSPGCGERSAPAWSQDGGQGENHKVKIKASGTKTCPAHMKDGRGLSTQQSAAMKDGALWQAMDSTGGVFTSAWMILKFTQTKKQTPKKLSMVCQRAKLKVCLPS